MAMTGADEDLLREAQAMIVALEPKPARQFARSARSEHHRARRDRAENPAAGWKVHAQTPT